jgi:hypothetical protein
MPTDNAFEKQISLFNKWSITEGPGLVWQSSVHYGSYHIDQVREYRRKLKKPLSSFDPST